MAREPIYNPILGRHRRRRDPPYPTSIFTDDWIILLEDGFPIVTEDGAVPSGDDTVFALEGGN